MDLKAQKRIAAQVLKCSQKNVVFDTTQLESIKEALTRADMRDLVNSNIVTVKKPNAQSRVRARKIAEQKSKGLQKGPGSKKAKFKLRSKSHERWLNKIRLERSFIKQLRENERITATTYREMYLKVKGNFFRNRRHIKQHIEEHDMFVKKE